MHVFVTTHGIGGPSVFSNPHFVIAHLKLSSGSSLLVDFFQRKTSLLIRGQDGNKIRPEDCRKVKDPSHLQRAFYWNEGDRPANHRNGITLLKL